MDGRDIELAIYISSGIISAAIVYVQNGVAPHIVAATQKEVSFMHDPSPSELKKRALAMLDQLLGELAREAGGMYELSDLFDSQQSIHHISIALSGLWLESEHHKKKQDFDQSTVITEAVLEDIVEKTEDHIHTTIVGTKANGYPVEVSEVIGIETSSLEVEYIETELFHSTKDSITDAVARHFAVADQLEVEYVPLSSVVLRTAQYVFGATDTFSSVVFDAEESLWVAMNKGSLQGMDYINYGRAELKRQLVLQKQAPDFVYAKDALSMYFEGRLEKEAAASLEYVLGIESDVLANLAQESLGIIPSPLYVLSAKTGEAFFDRFVTQKIGIKNTISITPEDFVDHVSHTQYVVRPSVEILALVLYRETNR